MNKLFKTISMLVLPVIVSIIMVGCSEDDKESGSFPAPSRQDVSTRISGVSAQGLDNPAPNIDMKITGTDLSKTRAVFFVFTDANGTVFNYGTKKFTVDDDGGLTVMVPNITVGDYTVKVVFSDNKIATADVTLVRAPAPALYSFSPVAAGAGEEVTISGADLDAITTMTVSGKPVTITSKEAKTLKFTMPTGVDTGPIVLTHNRGIVTSSWNILACETTTPASPLCKTNLVLNYSFEFGTGDVFTNWSKFNGGALMTATTVPGEFYEGTRAIKVNVDGTQGGTQQWRVQLASDLIPTTIGTSYTATAMLRSTAAGTKVRFSTAPTSLYMADTPIDATWTLLKWTFTANDPNTRIVLDMGGPANTVYYLDNIRLVAD